MTLLTHWPDLDPNAVHFSLSGKDKRWRKVRVGSEIAFKVGI